MTANEGCHQHMSANDTVGEASENLTSENGTDASAANSSVNANAANSSVNANATEANASCAGVYDASGAMIPADGLEVRRDSEGYTGEGHIAFGSRVRANCRFIQRSVVPSIC